MQEDNVVEGFLQMLTPEQAAKLTEPMAMSQCKVLRHPMGSHPQQLTGHFHQVVNLPMQLVPICPSVSDRLRRAQLMLEEVLETFEAMGLRMVLDIGDEGGPMILDHDKLQLDHVEGSRYDVIETADGLSDIAVIAAGTAVEFGIPMHVTDYEVYSSNLTKVREDGTPIINGVTEGYRVSDGSQVDSERYPEAGIWCDIRDPDEPGYRPDAPIGKILKPDSFVPANIPAAILAYLKQEF